MIVGNSTTENCLKHSSSGNEHSSTGTHSPHSEHPQGYGMQNKHQSNHNYHQYPPVPINWSEFLPPPPEHPPPLPQGGVCYAPGSPQSSRKSSKSGSSGISLHQSAMTSSQHSGSSGGFSSWGVVQQGQHCVRQDNFHNNPLPYPNPPHSGSQNRYQITPTSQHPPPVPYCQQSQQQNQQRNLHAHYQPRHTMSDYQPLGQQNQRCPNGRTCSSCDALTSPQQPLPNPEWYQPLHNNSNQNQVYACSSECSDHSSSRNNHHNHQPLPLPHQQQLSHQHGGRHPSHNSHSHQHQHHHHHQDHSTTTTTTATTVTTSMHPDNNQDNIKTGSYILSRCTGNNSFQEADETEREYMLKPCTYEMIDSDQRNCSECCSSREGDTCSCSESSCLYAEAGDPLQTTKSAPN